MTEGKKNGSDESMGRQKFEAEIIAKAWKDPEYKKRLLESPKEVLQEELRKVRPELTLPDDFKVFVHEEAPKAVHMVLPVNPAEHGDVSEEDWLDNVAGGFISVVAVAGVAVTAVAAANVAAAANVNVAGNVNVAANVHTAR